MTGGWGWGWGTDMVGSGGGTVFEDTFTEATGQLADHTPDVDNSGDGWTENMGDWQLSVSYVGCLEDDAEHQASCDVSLADCTIQCDCKYDLNGGDISLGLVVRGDSDLSNYWLVRLNPSNNRLEIVKCEEGEVASVESYTSITDNFQDNTAYTVKAVCSDARITAHCILGATDDNTYNEEEWMNTETRHGILGFHNTGVDIQTFDDFTIVV